MITVAVSGEAGSTPKPIDDSNVIRELLKGRVDDVIAFLDEFDIPPDELFTHRGTETTIINAAASSLTVDVVKRIIEHGASITFDWMNELSDPVKSACCQPNGKDILDYFWENQLPCDKETLDKSGSNFIYISTVAGQDWAADFFRSKGFSDPENMEIAIKKGLQAKAMHRAFENDKIYPQDDKQPRKMIKVR